MEIRGGLLILILLGLLLAGMACGYAMDDDSTTDVTMTMEELSNAD